MNVSRPNAYTPPARLSTPTPPPGSEPTPPENQEKFEKAQPSFAKVAYGTASVTGTIGMLAGMKIGASMGDPLIGLAAGLVLGAGIGVALAKFGRGDS
jgi:hypothetical protein